MSDGINKTPPNNTARITNDTLNHLHVDLNTLSAKIPPTGASNNNR